MEFLLASLPFLESSINENVKGKTIMSALIGEPHSLQRYIVFGMVAGLASGLVAAVSGIYLPYIAIPAVTIAGLLAGNMRLVRFSSLVRLARMEPQVTGLFTVGVLVALLFFGYCNKSINLPR